MKDILNKLGEYEQGLFFLHHGILAFPKWEFWSNIIGIKDRSFGYHMDYKFQIDIKNNEVSNAKFERLEALNLLTGLDIELVD